eukprot:GILK01010191.1.p1 GENE.GILK01010191.1~~GILK01010191.1.p1  ORF type:complete len:104 (+),score=4.22 GILK01010191.1:386-697(+)
MCSSRRRSIRCCDGVLVQRAGKQTEYLHFSKFKSLKKLQRPIQYHVQSNARQNSEADESVSETVDNVVLSLRNLSYLDRRCFAADREALGWQEGRQELPADSE